jgi:multiple sugar transport system permease protein
MPARVRSQRRIKAASDITTYLLLSLFSLVILAPILWMARLSFTTKFIAYSIPPVWFFRPILDNYRALFVDYSFHVFFVNSIIVSVASSLIAVPVAFLAAYAFNRYRTGGRGLQFGILGL